METIERLRAICESGKVSAKDKQLITDLSMHYEIPFEPGKGCANCWIDQAVILYNKMSKDENRRACSAMLRDDIDVMIDGVRINNATLTEELVKKYRGNGLPEHWFV